MASSDQCGPLNPPLGSSRTPANSCGPVGVNDQGDPNNACLLGDTPGPLGFGDYADPLYLGLRGMMRWADKLLPPSTAPVSVESGQMCLPDQSPSQAPSQVESPALSLVRAQELALMITTVFEGGTSMNYQALAGDFDNMGTSFGLIQWNFGQGTLGPLLTKMTNKNATAFANCFGSDADYETLKAALVAKDTAKQLTWARKVIKDHKSAWSKAFKAIGAVDEFNKIQRDEAAAKYKPAVDRCISLLREIKPELLTKVEFRSFAALFDLCVQQGSLGKAEAAIKKEVKSNPPATQYDLLLIAVTERGKMALAKYASDCISRRRGILQGKEYSSTENGVTKNRRNDQYHLIGEYGLHTVSNV